MYSLFSNLNFSYFFINAGLFDLSGAELASVSLQDNFLPLSFHHTIKINITINVFSESILYCHSIIL